MFFEILNIFNNIIIIVIVVCAKCMGVSSWNAVVLCEDVTPVRCVVKEILQYVRRPGCGVIVILLAIKSRTRRFSRLSVHFYCRSRGVPGRPLVRSRIDST